MAPRHRVVQLWVERRPATSPAGGPLQGASSGRPWSTGVWEVQLAPDIVAWDDRLVSADSGVGDEMTGTSVIRRLGASGLALAGLALPNAAASQKGVVGMGRAIGAHSADP